MIGLDLFFYRTMSTPDEGLRPEMCQLWQTYAAPDGRSRIIKAGYLQKKPTNHKFGGVKKRYFVLLYRALLYYEDKMEDHKWNDQAPKGIIRLEENVKINIFEDKNQFLLTTGKQNETTLLIAWAENLEETKAWVETIKNLFQELLKIMEAPLSL